ncbi:MAG: hypothetical protein E6Q88_04015 [Lysobacteraceae bacterium]|nr:MAG: hypothetical protein E6Q88_04015 [Xanthomonadaceae bacterium]
MTQRFVLMMYSICVLGVVATTADAQDSEYPEVTYPELPATGASAQAFVPAEWGLEYLKTGDLNKDKRDDLVFVLRMRRQANIVSNEGLGVPEFDTNPRILGVAFADGDGYRLALQDRTLIPRPDSPTMDDYLQDEEALAVRRGAFAVTLLSWSSAGSWSTSTSTFTFRYDGACFRLIGYDNDYMHRGSGQTLKTSVNFATGKAEFEQGSIEDDGPGERRAVNARGLRQPCLQDIGNGFEFDPGVSSPFEG